MWKLCKVDVFREAFLIIQLRGKGKSQFGMKTQDEAQQIAVKGWPDEGEIIAWKTV